MKAIYISKNNSPNKKVWLLALILVVGFMLLCMRVMAPYAVEAWVNKSGPDNFGYAVKVNDIDFKLLKGEMILEDVKVFDSLSKTDFAQASHVKVDFHFLAHLKGEGLLEIDADHVNLILSNDMLEQIKKFSHKAEGDFTAHISELVIKQMFDDKTQNIFTLNHTVMDVKDSSFNLHSKIADGGTVDLKGKASQIEGKLTNIPPVIVQRLSENELPVEIKDNKLNASITATATHEGVTGTIHPETNNFKLVDALKPKPRMWWEKKKEFDPLVIEIPFTLKDNFTLDFNPTVEELRKRNL